jgi:hypothetical protein
VGCFHSDFLGQFRFLGCHPFSLKNYFIFQASVSALPANLRPHIESHTERFSQNPLGFFLHCH